MEVNTLRILFTVISFVAFVAILIWAWLKLNSA